MSHPSWDQVVETPGDVLGQKIDHVPSAKNVPKAIGDAATAKVWTSGDGRYRIFMRKK